MILEVHVKPGSRKEGIERREDGRIVAHVHAPPEKGKANDAVEALLAEEYDVPRSAIEILTPKSRIKKVRIGI